MTTHKRPYRAYSAEYKRRHDQKKRGKPKKAFLFIAPNPIICLHQGTEDLTCYSSDKNKVHVDCWRSHFNVRSN